MMDSIKKKLSIRFNREFPNGNIDEFPNLLSLMTIEEAIQLSEELSFIGHDASINLIHKEDVKDGGKYYNFRNYTIIRFNREFDTRINLFTL